MSVSSFACTFTMGSSIPASVFLTERVFIWWQFGAISKLVESNELSWKQSNRIELYAIQLTCSQILRKIQIRQRYWYVASCVWSFWVTMTFEKGQPLPQDVDKKELLNFPLRAPLPTRSACTSTIPTATIVVIGRSFFGGKGHKSYQTEYDESWTFYTPTSHRLGSRAQDIFGHDIFGWLSRHIKSQFSW